MFIIAAITDFFDGYLARKHNLITDFGKFMDPLADKALVLVALILIVDKGLVAELIPVPYTLFTGLNLIAPISLIIMLIRELVVSGVRLVGANKGVVIAADKLGKIKTFTQDIALPILLLSYAFVGPLYCVFAYVGIAFLVAASIVSVISGIQYIVKNINLSPREIKIDEIHVVAVARTLIFYFMIFKQKLLQLKLLFFKLN